MSEKCGWSGCASESAMGYSPRPTMGTVGICAKHWNEFSATLTGSEDWFKCLQNLGYEQRWLDGLKQSLATNPHKVKVVHTTDGFRVVGALKCGDAGCPICNPETGRRNNRRIAVATKKTKREKKSRPDGAVGRPTNEHGGVRANWAKLFKDNASAKLSDEKLLTKMQKMFPDVKSRDMTEVAAVQRHRANYNRGGMTGGEVPRQSVPYVNGEAVEVRRGRKATGESKPSGGKRKVRIKTKAKA